MESIVRDAFSKLNQQRTFAILIDGLWSGAIGQREFYEVGAHAGIPADDLDAVLVEIQSEDGTWF